MVIASAIAFGAFSYVRQNFRIRRRFRGENPEVLGQAPLRYSAAATAAPFSGLPPTSRPISRYSSICGRVSAISVSSAANMAP